MQVQMAEFQSRADEFLAQMDESVDTQSMGQQRAVWCLLLLPLLKRLHQFIRPPLLFVEYHRNGKRFHLSAEKGTV